MRLELQLSSEESLIGDIDSDDYRAKHCEGGRPSGIFFSFFISNHTKSQTTEESAEEKRICFAWAKHWGSFHFAAIRRERRVTVWCVSVAYATLMPCLPVPLPLPSAAAFFGRLFGGGLREILARHMQSIWSTYGRTRKVRMIWSGGEGWARPGIRLAYAEHRVEIVPEFSVNCKVRPDAKKNFRSRLGYELSW